MSQGRSVARIGTRPGRLKPRSRASGRAPNSYVPPVFNTFLKGAGLAASPQGRKAIRQAVAFARSEEGRKVLEQARKVAASPEARRLAQQAGQAAKLLRERRGGL